jgi:hypothetical protein
MGGTPTRRAAGGSQLEPPRPAHAGSRRDRKPGAPTQGEGCRNGPRANPPGRVAPTNLGVAGPVIEFRGPADANLSVARRSGRSGLGGQTGFH